jgi:hypothetical protein
MMLDIKVNTNLLQYRFSEKAQKQMRFAASQAINATAAFVKTGELDNLKAVLDSPTPFTLSALALSKSSKKTLTATIFMKDRTAWYLEPYEDGGLTKLNPMGVSGGVQLNPEAQPVNQYGNLPRFTTTKLKARKNTFVGAPEGWKNAPRGIWQRYPYQKAKRRKLSAKNVSRFGFTHYKQRPPILLIEFAPSPHAATQRLNYQALAKKIVNQKFAIAFKNAMAKAMASAKP